MLFFIYLKAKTIKIRELSNFTVTQLVTASAPQAELLGSNPGECQISSVFRHVLYSVPP